MPARATEKLTKRVVDALKPKPGRDFTVWDRALAGFGVRVRETGTKSFILKYRNAQGQQRKMTPGSYGSLTPETARRMALSEKAKVAHGEYPAQARQTERRARTIADLCDAYLKEALAGRVLHRGKAKKPNTLRIDKGRIERHIKPLLGSKPIHGLSRRNIESFMYSVRDGATAQDVKTGPRGRARVTGGQGTAIKAVTLLSAVFNFGVRRGWVDNNPCHGVEKPADRRRERFLNPDEYGRLGDALELSMQRGVNPTAINAIRLIALVTRHGL